MSDTEAEKETKIIMVGPSGVGKTSLLAAMYSQIKKEVTKEGFSFFADSPTTNELNEKLEKLKDLATGDTILVDMNLGTEPSQNKSEFKFTLSKEGIPDIVLKFIDLPGGWYLGMGDYEEADRLMAQSELIIVAVDACSLLECEGKYNNKINKPDTICAAIERNVAAWEKGAKGATSAPPSIIFVLVKAEKYLHNNRKKELLDKAKECYAELIEPLKVKNYSIAMCCVETIGGVELNSIIDKEGMPFGRFIRLTGDNRGYRPKNCSVPLRLVFKLALESVASAIKRKTDDETLASILLTRILSIMGIKTKLAENIVKHKELNILAKSISEKITSEDLDWIHKPSSQ
jgi:Double-GTPase 2